MCSRMLNGRPELYTHISSLKFITFFIQLQKESEKEANREQGIG